ncbi:MAG: hypothetical protein DME60_09145 [Verrucomicrobia bacterium]|nr:MAG: hypothetical protein DME60_09145 [Verrucomicrobiota bacterium]
MRRNAVFFLIAIFGCHLRELAETLWRRHSCDDRGDVLALIIASREEVVGNIFALARRIS